jgi:thiamine kinase-like enzyme
MRDAGSEMVPEGSTILPDEQHLCFLDHMARLHAAFWGWRDDVGLLPRAAHYTILTPTTAALETERGGVDPVPQAVARGWSRLDRAAPRAGWLLRELVHDPGPLIEAMATTPATFVHGDWKLGNLGVRPDGVTVLLDWDRCGEGSACFDLAWYLAVNCDRLRLSKEAAIDAYRAALEGHGVDTGPWWDAQLALALLGALLMLGWSKADGDPAELGWWEDRALEAERHLVAAGAPG